MSVITSVVNGYVAQTAIITGCHLLCNLFQTKKILAEICICIDEFWFRNTPKYDVCVYAHIRHLYCVLLQLDPSSQRSHRTSEAMVANTNLRNNHLRWEYRVTRFPYRLLYLIWFHRCKWLSLLFALLTLNMRGPRYIGWIQYHGCW